MDHFRIRLRTRSYPGLSEQRHKVSILPSPREGSVQYRAQLEAQRPTLHSDVSEFLGAGRAVPLICVRTGSDRGIRPEEDNGLQYQAGRSDIGDHSVIQGATGRRSSESCCSILSAGCTGLDLDALCCAASPVPLVLEALKNHITRSLPMRRNGGGSSNVVRF